MPFQILDWGRVSQTTPTRIDYPCPHCGREAALPIRGMAIAMFQAGGVVFDGDGALPAVIRCTKCRRTFSSAGKAG